MKMKNVLMILISLAVVFAMVGVVSAANGIGGQTTGNTNIQYNVDESYIVTIPENVNFNNGLSGSGTVAASNVLLVDGKKLTVTMTSANGYGTSFNLTYGDPASSIPYTIKVGNTLIQQASYPVLTVPAGTTTGSVTLTFATTAEDIAKATKSGLHQDNLTFTCAVV